MSSQAYDTQVSASIGLEPDLNCLLKHNIFECCNFKNENN